MQCEQKKLLKHATQFSTVHYNDADIYEKLLKEQNVHQLPNLGR